MTTHELLIKARATQAARGHAKGMLTDDKGRVCMHGAFWFSLGADDASHIGRIQATHALGFETIEDMCSWNNKPERTLEEVVARFDEAIEATRPEPKLQHLPVKTVQTDVISTSKVEVQR